jgi:hypothetical protein
MISIITSCIDRELYLTRLLRSFIRLSDWVNVPFEWEIYLQGEPPSENLLNILDSLPFRQFVKVNQKNSIEPTSVLLNDFKKRIRYPLFLKLDDDALICSPDFLSRCVELSELIPNSIIYPLEIGGYTSIQAPVETRQVVYGSKSNVFYSVSAAVACSGLASLSPTSFMKIAEMPPGQMDAQFFWLHAKMRGLSIHQLQNGLIVEHQEGIEGQHYRKQLTKGQLV